TVLICVSNRVTVPSRFSHTPTGATICILPAPRTYSVLRHRMVNPYGRTVDQAFGGLSAGRWYLLPLLAVLKQVVLYSTTPLQLLARELRREGCEAILCQEYEYPRFDVCVLLGHVMQVPVFATFQGGNYQRSWIERYLRPPALHACAGLIIATETEAQRVRDRYGLAPHKLARIFNPIDLELWATTDRSKARAALNIPPDARVVIWHGRVSIQQKGLDLLLDAWKHIRRQRAGRDLRLLLIGTGKDKDRLQHSLDSMTSDGVFWVN